MSEEGMWLGGAIGLFAGLWTIAFMWHVGPSADVSMPVWWAFPYWLTSIGIGTGVWAGSACLGKHIGRSLGKPGEPRG